VAFAILSLTIVVAVQGFARARLLKLSGDHQHAALLADQKAREVTQPRRARTTAPRARSPGSAWSRVPAPELTPSGQVPNGTSTKIAVQVAGAEASARSA